MKSFPIQLFLRYKNQVQVSWSKNHLTRLHVTDTLGAKLFFLQARVSS